MASPKPMSTWSDIRARSRRAKKLTRSPSYSCSFFDFRYLDGCRVEDRSIVLDSLSDDISEDFLNSGNGIISLPRKVQVASVGMVGASNIRDVLQRLEEGQGSASNGGKGMRLQGVRPNTRSINRFCVRTSPFLTHRTCPFRILCIAS